MNKKILSLALSGMLAVSAVFGLAACRPQEGGNMGGVNEGGNGGNGGNAGNTGGNGSGIKPGTVISDEEVKNAVFSALAEAELEGLTYAGSVDLSVTQGQKTTVQKIGLEGTALMDEGLSGDLCLSLEGDEGLAYLLGFLRKDGVYYTTGEAEGDTVDFSALKAQLKADDPTVLERGEAGVSQGLFSAPAAAKLVKNLAVLAGGIVTKTEGGYSLSFDLVEGAGSLLEGAIGVAETIEKTASMTVTGLFSQKFVDETLTTLLDGVTAKELADFVALLPEELQTALPKPESGTAKEYLTGLLRSGSFYTALAGDGEPWTKYRTFGEVTLADAVSLLTGGETELGSLKLKEMLQEVADGLENRIVSLLLDTISVEGQVTEESAELTVTFSFDEDKKLLGLAIDALATGNVTPSAEEQPDGGTQPEDGSGDGTTATAETPGAPETPEAPGTSAAKVRFGLKMSATCTQSAELFDLTGCRYQGENGPVTIG